MARVTSNQKTDIETTERAFGLPDLDGSQKQIAWARDIRAGYVADVIRVSGESSASEGSRQAAVNVLLSDAREQTRASWWIDKRPVAMVAFPRVMKEVGAEEARQDEISLRSSEATVTYTRKQNEEAIMESGRPHPVYTARIGLSAKIKSVGLTGLSNDEAAKLATEHRIRKILRKKLWICDPV